MSNTINGARTIARRPSVLAQERQEYFAKQAAITVGAVIVGMTLALLAWSLTL